MLKPVAFANAVTTVGVAGYMICMVLSAIVPDLVFNISQSWLHALNLNVLRLTEPMNIGSALFGAISFAALVWIASYIGVSLYNKASTTKVFLFNFGIIIAGALLYYLISNR